MLQFEGQDEVVRIRHVVQQLLRENPVEQVLSLVTALLPPLPARARALARLVLRAYCRGSLNQSPTVDWAARQLGVTGRTLRRAWNHEMLPPPAEFLRWLTLLYIAFTAEWGGQRRCNVAAAIGVDSQRLARIRHNLLSTEARKATKDRQGGFDIVLCEFALRCGVSRLRAEELLQQAAS